MEKPSEITLRDLNEAAPKGSGLIVGISREIPVILNIGDHVIEIYRGNNFRGTPTIQVKASREVGITGAHLLQKAYFERDKLVTQLKDIQEKYDFLIDQRIKEKHNDH